MTRCESLRTKHGWSRQQMAGFFNCDVSSVARLESRTDGREPGSKRRLLDMLEKNPRLMPPADRAPPTPANGDAPAREPAA